MIKKPKIRKEPNYVSTSQHLGFQISFHDFDDALILWGLIDAVSVRITFFWPCCCTPNRIWTIVKIQFFLPTPCSKVGEWKIGQHILQTTEHDQRLICLMAVFLQQFLGMVVVFFYMFFFLMLSQ